MDGQPDVLRDRGLVACGQLHEQVVWMLAIPERGAPIRFAGLEEERVPPGADGERLGAEHAVQVERAPSDGTHRHEHRPIGAADLVVAAAGGLMVEVEVDIAVDHHRPAARRMK